jgi:hypothetical protein
MKGYFVQNTVLKICHMEFKDTKWRQCTEVIFLGQNKFRTVLLDVSVSTKMHKTLRSLEKILF